MTEQTIQTLILRDQHGNLYVIPHATLAISRVPAQQLPALQQALDEVAGYLFTPMVQNDFLTPEHQKTRHRVVMPSARRTRRSWVGWSAVLVP